VWKVQNDLRGLEKTRDHQSKWFSKLEKKENKHTQKLFQNKIAIHSCKISIKKTRFETSNGSHTPTPPFASTNIIALTTNISCKNYPFTREEIFDSYRIILTVTSDNVWKVQNDLRGLDETKDHQSKWFFKLEKKRKKKIENTTKRTNICFSHTSTPFSRKQNKQKQTIFVLSVCHIICCLHCVKSVTGLMGVFKIVIKILLYHYYYHSTCVKQT